MTITKLKILAKTTVSDYPEESLQKFIEDGVAEVDEIKELFRKLVTSTIICDGVLLARPEVYNDLVKKFNKF